MKRFGKVATMAAALLGCCTWEVARAAEPPPTKEGIDFFESKIRPVLVKSCYECHSAEHKKIKGKLRLDDYAAMLKGGESGKPAVVPGDPEKSHLIFSLTYKDVDTADHDALLMPPPKNGKAKKLPESVIDDFRQWIKMGAPYPQGAAARSEAAPFAVQKHWAFVPPAEPEIPAVHRSAWVKNAIDRFVLAKLEAQNLHPSYPADKRTLIRRATFDLIGLPPTEKEVEAFEADASSNAFEKVVDRLLASPRYGERWGRYWLDVARYSDTQGYAFESERGYPNAYTYRDWVIRSFNEDLPYDQFLIQQIAADKLDLKGDNRPLAAEGFLTLGRRFLNNRPDIMDDRIDVVCRGTMALTVVCARCHNHKFDPISQKDYYSLYGIFNNSPEVTNPPKLAAPAQTPAYQKFQQDLSQRQAALNAFVGKKFAQAVDNIRSPEHLVGNLLAAQFVIPTKALASQKPSDVYSPQTIRGWIWAYHEWAQLRTAADQLKSTDPTAPARPMCLEDARDLKAQYVFLRGNPASPGDAVKPHFVAFLAGGNPQTFTEGSGRLELAQNIASAQNPLTARVMVNRIWLHHFGQGLVRTPSDFGMRSDPPTHPELLDWLALRFEENGWSVKKMQKLIMLSATYQQSSEGDPAVEKADPENLRLSHFNRLRLDLEATRDSLLVSAGRLDQTMGGRPVEILQSNRRTVYSFIDRQNLPGVFRAFDFASPDATSPQRFTTTVPQQALFLMNSPFVVQQAQSLVQRPEVAGELDPARRIAQLYRIVYQRSPRPDEISLGVQFVRSEPATNSTQLGGWAKYAQVLLESNEFVFVD